MFKRLLCAAVIAAVFLASPPGRAETITDCPVGAYRLSDGSVVDIAPSEGETLRWRRYDGTTGALHKIAPETWTSTLGWTNRADGKTVSFSDCATGEIAFDGLNGRRLKFEVTDLTFQSHDVSLAGRLVLPKGEEAVPIVVLIHGSERDSARETYSLQRLLPAEGVGVFVYDKRGTGASGGTYSQDFSLLADDAVAAVREARRLAGARAGRVGFQGGSQGGWVAPLAANRVPVDFVIVCFGLAVTVLEEDQSQLVLEMELKGHPPEVIAKALEVAKAAEDVIESAFTQGFAEFDAVRAKYRGEPWYKDVHGNFTHFLLPYNEAELRKKAQAFIFGTPFRYEPMRTLRASHVPQLWILGDDDLEAPSAETSRRIKQLIAEGRSFTLANYAHAEHGMTLYETTPEGERISTRFPDGYFAMIRDFARTGGLSGDYGARLVTRPNPHP